MSAFKTRIAKEVKNSNVMIIDEELTLLPSVKTLKCRHGITKLRGKPKEYQTVG